MSGFTTALTDAAIAKVLGSETVGEAVADIPAGGVGAYAFAWRNTTSTPAVFGDTSAGSALRPAALSQSNTSVGADGTAWQSSVTIYTSGGTNTATLSGTWRCLGSSIASGTFSNYPHTLWRRIL